jgi:hypothetical protein
MVAQNGGDLEVRLSRKTPLWWRVIDALQGALDHTTVLNHVQGSLAPSLLLAGFVVLATLWRAIRHPTLRGRYWGSALTLGLALTCLRAFYAWFRQEDLTSMYVSYLRTMDLAWEVNPIILGATGILCTCSSWLFLGSHRLWSKALAGLLIMAPTSLLVFMWFGVSLTLNLLASRYYGGMPLYGYGVGAMALISTLVEAAVAALLLGIIGRRQESFAPAGTLT